MKRHLKYWWELLQVTVLYLRCSAYSATMRLLNGACLNPDCGGWLKADSSRPSPNGMGIVYTHTCVECGRPREQFVTFDEIMRYLGNNPSTPGF